MLADDLEACEGYAAHKAPPPRRSAIRNILADYRRITDLNETYLTAIADLQARAEAFEEAHQSLRMDYAKADAERRRVRQANQQLLLQRHHRDAQDARRTSPHPHLDWLLESFLIVSLCGLCAWAGYLTACPVPWAVA